MKPVKIKKKKATQNSSSKLHENILIHLESVSSEDKDMN